MTPFRKDFSKSFPFTDTGFMLLLAASTALSITVPGSSNQKFRACFRGSFTDEVWVRLNGTAVLPSAGVATATYLQEFLPLLEPKIVKGGDSLSFISAGTPSIGVSFLLVEPQV
jgi:hypothetical protein